MMNNKLKKVTDQQKNNSLETTAVKLKILEKEMIQGNVSQSQDVC